jgi:hypothetical protein
MSDLEAPRYLDIGDNGPQVDMRKFGLWTAAVLNAFGASHPDLELLPGLDMERRADSNGEVWLSFRGRTVAGEPVQIGGFSLSMARAGDPE